MRAIAFSEIALNRSERKILKALYRSPVIQTDQNEKVIDRLIDLGLAESDFVVQTRAEPNRIKLSEYGYRYLTYAKRYDATIRNAWIRYIITTAIALIALIKSFMPELSALTAWLLQQ